MKNQEITNNIISYLKKHSCIGDRNIFLETNREVIEELPACFQVEIAGVL